MAELVVQNILLLGVVEAALVSATAAGDTFDNDGKTYFQINNADASSMTVTIVGQKTLPTGASANKAIVIVNATTQLIGPFPVGIYNTDGANEVVVTYSSVTSLTVGAFSVNDQNN